MPLSIIRNDITKMRVDAIVNSTNESLRPAGNGVDALINESAGPDLRKACAAIGHCDEGSAVITEGFMLPCRYIIHTVGPIWRGGNNGEEKKLRNCYRSIFEIAKKKGFSTVAVPIISAGAYGYPKREALEIATDEIRQFLLHNDSMMVYIVVYNSEMVKISERLFTDVAKYISDNYVDIRLCSFSQAVESRIEPEEWERDSRNVSPTVQADESPAEDSYAEDSYAEDSCVKAYSSSMPLASVSKMRAPTPARMDPVSKAYRPAGNKFVLDESFCESVIRIMREKKIRKSSTVYNRANITKAVFSKINQSAEMYDKERTGAKLSAEERKKKDYRPSKATAMAVAAALELDIPEFLSLIGKAGYTLSNSVMGDVVVRYFIERKEFDVFEINEVLFSYDQPLLGGN